MSKIALPPKAVYPIRVKRELIDLFEAAMLGAASEIELTVSCLTCKAFSEAQELCGLYHARPPARTIAYGCAQWEDLDEPAPPSKPKILAKTSFDDLDDDIPF